jgi:SsrA-binding protein
MTPPKPTDKERTLIAENRKARMKYAVEDHFEAGMVLTGSEVKSLRAGKCQLVDSYAYVRRGEIFLASAHIGAYSHGGYANHEPTRERKLLLHRREIEKLKTKLERRGYTLIPLSIYFKAGHAKIDLGLCVGKEGVDRRADIKERDSNREMDKVMKAARRR